MREVTHALSVWDAGSRRQIQLPPGTILTEYQIRRHEGREDGAEVYAMEFDSGGRRYACPLFLFQPRTQVVDPAAVTAAGF